MTRGRAANYDEQREMILAKAAHLFARGGYPGTSMNQVADATGLSKATLYHYFRDKYSLLVDIAESHVTRLEALVADLGAQGFDPETHMRVLIARIMSEYAGAQDAHRVLTSDVRFLEPADKRRIQAKERRVVEGFAQAIAAWHPEHERSGLAKPLTMLLFGMINWMFTWMRPNGALSYPQIASIVTDLFFAGVPGVQPPAAKNAIATVRPTSRASKASVKRSRHAPSAVAREVDGQ
jgi:AcrR family transcriptional regulator